jgi:hypothetical protein
MILQKLRRRFRTIERDLEKQHSPLGGPLPQNLAEAALMAIAALATTFDITPFLRPADTSDWRPSGII